MNENDQTNVPPPITAVQPPAPIPDRIPDLFKTKPLSWWLRKFFACNPFYLVSAALLLYGCYRVSIDAPMFHVESARLLFNFSSVQVYEFLLVLVAIFLARRSLWYDSTLLVGLENLLVFAPFILISLGALIDVRMGQVMCIAGMIVATLRFAGLKRYFTQLNLPWQLLLIGFLLLAINVILPLDYRHNAETQIGMHPDAGPAYIMNGCAWLLILPALLALFNIVPKAEAPAAILPQHRWLPAGVFSLWFIVTFLHICSLNFVYQYEIHSASFAPLAWALAWTLFLRNQGLERSPGSNWLKYALTFSALLTPCLAAYDGSTRVFMILGVLNVAAYLIICLRDRSNRLAGHLVYAAALLLVAGIPDNWLPVVAHGLTGAQCMLAGAGVYLLFWTMLLRNPKLGLVGAIVFGAAILICFRNVDAVGYWAVQGGLVFFLLHSLRWDGAVHRDANIVRIIMGIAWVITSLVWVNSGSGKFWMPIAPGALVAVVYCAYQMYRRYWSQFMIPAAALIVMLSGPCSITVKGLSVAPVGLLAVVASFLCLGFGTIAALTRHLWHKPETGIKTEASQPVPASRENP